MKEFELGTPDFYESVDSCRYRNESYIPPLLDSVVESGKKVLEIGFGLGTDLRYFSKKGMNVFGVDLSFSNALLVNKGLAYRWISLQYLLRKLRGDRTSKEDLITQKYDHTPLSKVYSKNEARLMFAKFRDLEISIVTFGGVKKNKKLW